MSSLVDDCTRFFQDLILGDFNENQMVSAQLVGGAISLIPVVDQIMDARDIAGCLFRINRQGGFPKATLNQKVELGFAAFGVIPGIGSAFKTVFKPLYQQRKTVKGSMVGGVEMIERMLGQRKGGAVRWVQTLDWVGNTNQAVQQADKALNSSIELLELIGSDPWWCPEELAQLAVELTPGLVGLRGKLGAPIREASQEIRGFLEQMLGEHAAAVALGALGNVRGSRAGHSQRHGGGAGAKPSAKEQHGKPVPFTKPDPLAKSRGYVKPDPHREVKGKPRVVLEEKAGAVANTVVKLCYDTYKTLDFMKKGLIGEHIVDHHVIEQKNWGMNWNRHDMIGGGPGKKEPGWQAAPRKLNDAETPKYLCTPCGQVVLHGIDSAWITNRPFPQQYAIVEAKANQNSKVSLRNLLGEIKNPAAAHRRSTGRTKSRGKPQPQANFMQMGKDWIDLYINTQLEEHLTEIYRGGKNYTCHLFLVTPMQTLDHVHAMNEIISAGFVNQPARAQIFAKNHAVHDVEREFGERDLDGAEEIYKQRGKPNRARKKPPKRSEKMSTENFRAARRQPYLSEESFLNTLQYYDDGERLYRADLQVPGIPPRNIATMFHVIATGRWRKFQLRHTAGESPLKLAEQLTMVVEGFEEFVEAGLEVPEDKYCPAFPMGEMIDVYVDYLHLLCFAILLRREDLIDRIYWLIKGTDYDGEDGVVEKLLSLYLPDRPDMEEVYWELPYGLLLDALESQTPDLLAVEMKKYVKSWYKNMKGQAGFWGKHEKIKPAFTPYVGYWAMCAGAFTYLLDIDDRGYRDELVFPRELVDYARSFPRFTQKPSAAARGALRVEGGQPCPLAGFWSTPAQQGSRRLYEAGEIMPTFEHSAYGATIWQWSEDQ